MLSTDLYAQVVTKPDQIGINIEEPVAGVSLHIRDDFESIRLDGASPFLSFYNGADYRGYLYMTGDNMYLYNRKSGNLFFGSNNGPGITLNDQRYVGIGTTFPQKRLHVADGPIDNVTFHANTIAAFEKGSGNGYLSILTTSTTERGILFADEGATTRGGIIYNNGSAPNGLQLRTNGNFTRMTIDDIGDVGIGIGNPGRPLDVKSRNGGDEYGIRMFRSSTSDNWELSLFQGEFNFFYNGGQSPVAKISTSGIYTGSDRRLKKNIRTYKEVLPDLAALQIATYQYLADKEQRTTLGLIAQDVAEVYPEIVSLAPNREGEMYYSIDYSKTGVLALKAIQELQQQLALKNTDNDKLQARVKTLEAQNEALQHRLSSIEAVLSQLQENCCRDVQEPLRIQPEVINKEHPFLRQNEPNPFTGATAIRYFIPQEVQKAMLQIVALDGSVLKQINITAKGAGQIELDARALSAGTYIYSLIIDNEVYESRQMVVKNR